MICRTLGRTGALLLPAEPEPPEQASSTEEVASLVDETARRTEAAPGS